MKVARSPQPLHDPSVIIIGCGMSGILMAIRLLQAGFTRINILEKAATLGGTWRDNRYPGLACDVPAYMYTYSFAPNTECKHRYARGPEIQAYFQRVFDQYGLSRYTQFNCAVTDACHTASGWQVTSADGQVRQADVVISATGVLHHPNIPALPGLDQFAGSMMHTARWDDSVTLAGKRVGVIGTGSTAAQLVSALVSEVGELRLFQRTPQWVSPCFDSDYSRWRLTVMRRLPQLAAWARERYRDAFLPLSRLGLDPVMHSAVNLLCRSHLRLKISDPALRARLTPDYRPGCKRLILSDTFYDAIQQPNATLVTTGIAGIEADGIRTQDGELHRLDVLLLATGFKALVFMWPMTVTGRNGRRLEDAWADGARAYRTVALPDFPNFFMLQGPHSPVGNFSLIDISECQADYILQMLALLRDGRCQSVMPRQDATDAFNASLHEAAARTIWATGCESWYLGKDGVPAIWPWDYRRFEVELGQLRLDELELTC